MYFGGASSAFSIRLVWAFINGYQSALRDPDNSLPFTHFTRWVAARYRVNAGAMGGIDLILEHVGGGEREAFDEFFRMLPDYIKDMAELGTTGIEAHYNEVMNQIHEQRHKDT